MLTARNAIWAAITIAILSILGSVISLLQPPDSDGFDSDSYGTRGTGFRGVFETLQRLEVPVQRLLVPADAIRDTDATLVLWAPYAALLEREPVNLQRISGWVSRGGRLVLTPPAGANPELLQAMMNGKATDPVDALFSKLGLDGLRVSQANPVDGSADESGSFQDPIAGIRDDLSITARMERAKAALNLPRHEIQPSFSGCFADLQNAVTSIDVPQTGVDVLLTQRMPLNGRIVFQDAVGDQQTLAASFPLGRGEVVVVGDSRLLQNQFIARRDNAVLAVHLLGGSSLPVYFDEFYHGLTIRGNPMWLVTQPKYAVTTVLLLTVVALWAWRRAVFLGPALTDKPVSRRTLVEYIESMSRFFVRGHASHAFLLREVRGGVLWNLRHRLGLNPGQESVNDIVAALERKNPAAAVELRAAVQSVDDLLLHPRRLGSRDTLMAMQRISACL